MLAITFSTLNGRGYIINSQSHAHIEFDRVGNVYAIDAFVKNGSGKPFHRQAPAL